jgi:hypothetical protein
MTQDQPSELDTRDLETKLRQDIALQEWQIRDILPMFEAELARQVAAAQKPLVMPKHRRRALTAQERSFEAEVASFVRAYPDMTLRDYWLGRWHQKSDLGAAALTPKSTEPMETPKSSMETLCKQSDTPQDSTANKERTDV